MRPLPPPTPRTLSVSHRPCPLQTAAPPWPLPQPLAPPLSSLSMDLTTHIRGRVNFCPFGHGLLHLVQCLSGSPPVACARSSFLLKTNNIPLRMCTAFCLSIHWTPGLLPPFGYCEECHYGLGVETASPGPHFQLFWVGAHTSQVALLGHTAVLCLSF